MIEALGVSIDVLQLLDFTRKVILKHDYNDLICIFDRLFKESHHTVLISGDDEPIYLPLNDKFISNRIIFAHGFFQSAMHEISHWCIAGEKRRQLVDYGYWYEPDGRSIEQQRLFERYEVKPQALEWLFCEAAGYRFRVSVDNLGGEISPTELQFKKNIVTQAKQYLKKGMNDRSERFISALNKHYQTSYPSESEVRLEKLF